MSSSSSRAMATWPFQNTRSPRRRLGERRRSGRAPIPACRCRAGRGCRRPARRPAPAPSNRCRARSCRPTNRACRGTARRRRRNPRCFALIGARCACGTCQPDAVTAKRSSCRATASRAPIGRLVSGGVLMSGRGNTSVRSARTLWVAAGPGAAERIGRQPADIAVAFELAPGPAFVGRLVDGHALAEQNLGIERRLVRRRAPHIGDWLDHLDSACPRRNARPRPGLADISPRSRGGTDAGGDRARPCLGV